MTDILYLVLPLSLAVESLPGRTQTSSDHKIETRSVPNPSFFCKSHQGEIFKVLSDIFSMLPLYKTK